jgi:hypothetical protein
MNRTLSVLIFLSAVKFAVAQSSFSGDLQINSEFYQRDSIIGATGTPHYDNLLSSNDAWLNMYYRNDPFGIEAGIRLDLFLNSNLHNPGTPYTDAGIGRWYVSKRLQLNNKENFKDELKITAGHIYEQFGSGIVFRAYEERTLGIDNALFGLQLEYNINDEWTIKALAGQQKDLFDRYAPVIKGISADGVLPTKNPAIIISPGISFLNRTLDQDDMNLIVSQINSYSIEDRFVPTYNVYAGSIYNTLTVKDITWYFEYAQKTSEAIRNLEEQFISSDGNVLYTSLTYSSTKIGEGFGITGQLRTIDNWVMRVSPNTSLLDGILNYLPSFTRQNSLRLTARYSAVAQELGEMAYQVSMTYTPNKGYTLNANYSDITDEARLQLFRELFVDLEIRKTKYKLLVGAQYVLYNQEVIENHPDVPLVKAITPFTEIIYKFDRKKSLRMELQYQHSEQDFGSWIYGLAEFNIAPKWSFALSDMWNFRPLKTDDDLHYYSVFGAFIHKSARFTLNYVKQIEGIVCTGGICRFEPAFSGLKAGIITTF